MGLSGNISTISLAEVFQWLNTGQKTGTLCVQSAKGVRKEVYFKQGAINSASSSDPAELVAQFAMKAPMISDSQLVELIKKNKEDLITVGKMLVKNKVLTGEQLERVLMTTSEEIIYDLFLWQEGQFEFLDNQLPERPLPDFQLDIPNLIFEAARREDEWARIHRIFPEGGLSIKPKVDKIVECLPLSQDVAKVLSCVDGFSSLDGIVRERGTTQFETCLKLMELYEQGLVEVGSFAEQTLTPEKREEDDVAIGIRAVEQLLDAGKLGEAERRLSIIEKMAPERGEINQLQGRLEDLRAVTTARELIGPQAVPKLGMSVDDITKLDLSPQETFLLSRINGSWDVHAIIKVAPYDEAVCFKVLKKMLDRGLIKLS